MSRRDRTWGDHRHVNRGARERAADARHRVEQERRRAAIDRASREAEGEDAEVVVPDGPTVRPAPPVSELDDVLQSVVAARGWGERLSGAGLAQRWEEVVGPALASRSQPARLAGGVLVVVVESPAWAAQLRYLTAQIAGRATAVTGSAVDEVRIVVGDTEEG